MCLIQVNINYIFTDRTHFIRRLFSSDQNGYTFGGLKSIRNKQQSRLIILRHKPDDMQNGSRLRCAHKTAVIQNASGRRNKPLKYHHTSKRWRENKFH